MRPLNVYAAIICGAVAGFCWGIALVLVHDRHPLLAAGIAVLSTVCIAGIALNIFYGRISEKPE